MTMHLNLSAGSLLANAGILILLVAILIRYVLQRPRGWQWPSWVQSIIGLVSSVMILAGVRMEGQGWDWFIAVMVGVWVLLLVWDLIRIWREHRDTAGTALVEEYEVPQDHTGS